MGRRDVFIQTILLFARIRDGMLAEAKRIHAKGLSWKRMHGLGLEYHHLAKFLRGEVSKYELIEKLNTEIWRYARRQMTWFKRDKNTKWYRPDQSRQIERHIKHFLSL
jgi:tRNA dimethylallyltransferase